MQIHRSNRCNTPTGKFNKMQQRVRVSGLIPAVVYGAGQESIAVTVDPKSITRILHSESVTTPSSTSHRRAAKRLGDDHRLAVRPIRASCCTSI